MKNHISNWDELPLIMGLHEVALIFNVTDLTVKKWVYNGTISGFKLGRRWMFNRDYIKSVCEGAG